MRPKRDSVVTSALFTVLCLCPLFAHAQSGGMKIYNSDVLAPHTDIVGYDEGKPLAPIRIVGARNGTFSGKVVVAAPGSLESIAAKCSELRHSDGKANIPVSQIRVRYAFGGGGSSSNCLSRAVSRFDNLCGTPPAKVGPLNARRWRPTDGWIAKDRATLPIWVTVTVPAGAKPGDYEGVLSIYIGKVAKEVPVRLKVCALKLPGPRKWRTWSELIQSPDSVALQYGVPLWSERHWELMEKSMEHAAAVGTRTCYVPLICETNMGNSETMIRWKKTGGGKYTHDFSTMEKYLDMVERHLGKSTLVCFYVWERFLDKTNATSGYESKQTVADRQEILGRGPEVTFAEAGGKGAKGFLPPYVDAKSREIWGPLFAGLRARMKKRGMKNLGLGIVTDAQHPSQGDVEFFKAMMPGVPWVKHSHNPSKDLHGEPYCYQLDVWGLTFASPNKAGQYHGWSQPELHPQFSRNHRDNFPMLSFRYLGEMNIAGKQRGFGRLGADFWVCLKDKRGRTVGRVSQRYPKAGWRNLAILTALTAPGPHGAIATARLEMLREGLQECEARILLDWALLNNRIEGRLAAKCKNILIERDQAMIKGFNIKNPDDYRACMVWYMSPSKSGDEGVLWHTKSDWQSRSEALFNAAYEVAMRADPASQKAKMPARRRR